MSTIWYTNEEGEFVQMMNGILKFGDSEIPIADGEFKLPETRFTRMIADTEKDLLDRYHRGELDGSSTHLR